MIWQNLLHWKQWQSQNFIPVGSITNDLYLCGVISLIFLDLYMKSRFIWCFSKSRGVSRSHRNSLNPPLIGNPKDEKQS